jgi:pimeloyl-ACP methyl ester carboxylesterase
MQAYLPIYPVRWMLHYDIPTYQYIQEISVPITIFHGTSDWTVRYKNSKRLKPFLKPADELITIKGGSHNNLYTYRQMVEKLDSVLLLQ